MNSALTPAVAPAITDELTKIFFQHGVIGVVALGALFALWKIYRAAERLRDDHAAELRAIAVAHAKEVSDLRTAHAKEVSDLRTAHAAEIAQLRDECHEEAIALYATMVQKHEERSKEGGDLVMQISDLVKNLKGTYIRRR